MMMIGGAMSLKWNWRQREDSYPRRDDLLVEEEG